MKLNSTQAAILDRFYDNITDSGSVFDEIRGIEDGVSELRFFLNTPPDVFVHEFSNHTQLPYCVLRFHPMRGFTYIHYYNTHLEALQDNEEFPVRG